MGTLDELRRETENRRGANYSFPFTTLENFDVKSRVIVVNEKETTDSESRKRTISLCICVSISMRSNSEASTNVSFLLFSPFAFSSPKI